VENYERAEFLKACKNERQQHSSAHNCDLNNDGVVNMRDIGIACSNFMKT
jgi:hypothetical protein